MADRNARPNTRLTLFDLGSVSEQFASVAVGVLETQEKLALEDRLEKHFADVPEDKRPITVRQLLDHTSGLEQTQESDRNRPAGFNALLEEDWTGAAYEALAPAAFSA